MKIAIPKERTPGETRVAGSPDVVKKFVGFGFDVIVETGAGAYAGITDEDFRTAGATIADDPASTLKDADVILKVQRPILDENNNELALMKEGAFLVGHLAALTNRSDVDAYAKAGVNAFAMELMPRISRAQSMDVLSSQSNLAGYRAVIDAAAEYHSALPLMMTSAGTVAPAKVFIMGVGVAGLQAIATAKRMGAVVTATDVRPATKEQVESLGGKFIMVDEGAMKEAETAGGYAKEMSEDFRRRQAEVVAAHVQKQDIVITTALIPGRPAPELVSEEMVKSMRPGSVILDMAVEAGGNCPLSKPGETVVKYGVKILGLTNMPGRLPRDSSMLFAKNLLNFLSPHVDKESKTFKFDWEDETVKGTLLTRDGKIVNPALIEEGK
jgi:H+-translocating NAD(P) transhydrogenase subunit alpha